MLKKFTAPYIGVFKVIRLYWSIYGGWRALVLSPYFHFSIILTVLMSHFWNNEAWWEVAISVLPSIIGFALGGYAIWLGFGDEKFRHLITENNDNNNHSPYLEVSATFAHFIMVQLLALFAAIIAKAMNFPISKIQWLDNLFIKLNVSQTLVHEDIAPILYGLSFLLFIYAIMTAVAATFAVFRVATWFDKYRNTLAKENNNKQD